MTERNNAMHALTETPVVQPQTDTVTMTTVAVRAIETLPAANDDRGSTGPKLLERRRRRTQRRSVR